MAVTQLFSKGTFNPFIVGKTNKLIGESFSNRILEDSKGKVTSYSPETNFSGDIFSKNDSKVMPHPDSQYKLYIEIYQKVPVAKNAVDNTANFAVHPGFQVEGSDNGLIEKFSLDLIMINIMKQMQIWGNAYLEIGRAGDEITELKLLPPEQMFVVAKRGASKDGEIKGYKQIVKMGEEIDFNPEEIIHFKWNDVGSMFYGISDYKAITNVLARLLTFQEDIGEIIHRYAQPYVHWKLGTENSPPTQSQISDFIGTLDNRSVGEDLVSSFTVQSEVVAADIRALQPDGMIKHMENQLITGLSLPSVFVRGGESSNKATAQVELQAYDRKVNTLRKVVSSNLEAKLFKGARIVWNEMTIQAEETKSNMVGTLVSQGQVPTKTALQIAGFQSWVDEYEKDQKEADMRAEKMMKQNQMQTQQNPQNQQKTPNQGKQSKPDEKDFKSQAEWLEALDKWYNIKRTL